MFWNVTEEKMKLLAVTPDARVRNTPPPIPPAVPLLVALHVLIVAVVVFPTLNCPPGWTVTHIAPPFPAEQTHAVMFVFLTARFLPDATEMENMDPFPVCRVMEEMVRFV